ncbi:hypothetical protein ABK040_003611 [Willaertia magna]
MKENNTNSNTICVFEFQNETHDFNSNNKNEGMITNFKEVENVKNICWDSYNFYYVTTNNHGYQLVGNSSVILNENNIIDISVNFGEKNILTRDKVYLTKKLVDLPEIDLDDKFIKLATGDTKKFAFLLTERGKIFIHGENVNGVFGCDVKKLSKFERQTKLDKLESKIVEIKCGYLFAILRCENGDCYGSGHNRQKNIGIEGNPYELREFTLLEQLKGKVKQFDCGCYHTVYLTKSGEIYVTGKFNDGQLGKNYDTTISHLTCIGLTKLELNSYKNNNILNCCKQSHEEECTFPVKRKEEYFIEVDCNLDKFIGKFGEREDEVIEMGIQLEKKGKLIFVDENVISATVIFATCNYLTQDHVVLKNKKLNDLPQLDQDDKIINFVTPGDLTCCFLLTEKGKVYIYGINTYGIFGCKTIKNNNEITSFVKHTELEEKMKSKIVDIKCGYSFCVIRCENGDCYGSGYNYYRDMGITTIDELSEFTLLKDKVKQYGCGHFSSVFLTFDGEIYVCGKQDNGQFGTEFPLNVNLKV